jgi:tRNA threonylcarbamoyladenosine biosynthesis protein TsaB
VILAMDTSTPHCTVAFNGRSAGVVAPTGHAEHLACLIREVVPDTGLITGIVAGVGPGPYTGLRVGVVTATVMAESLGVPVAGVCSLDGLGARLGEGVVVTDARRREVFAARYEAGVRVAGPVVIPPAELTWTGPVVGPAVERYPDLGEFALLEAADLLRVRADLPARPWYLREPDAKPPR